MATEFFMHKTGDFDVQGFNTSHQTQRKTKSPE